MSTVSLFSGGDNRTVNVTTNFSHQGSPCSISFYCSRIYPPNLDSNTLYLNPRIHNIFESAVKGRAHENIEPNESGVCSLPGSVAGHCGNMRGYLAECRCEDLNRKIKPYIRNHFEKKVIDKILKHYKITQSLSSGRPFQFNLAIFCSGRLLGEEILLFRLLNELYSRRASGTISLFLIDREYTSAIRLGNSSTALHQNQYLIQFLTEICGCLPPSLKINGTIFAEASHYIDQAQTEARFKHDLLIGADIEDTQVIMDEISSKAAVIRGQRPLALVRNVGEEDLPGSCDIVCGQLTNCSLYADPPLDSPMEMDPPQFRRRQSEQIPWEVAVSAAAVVGIALAVILGVTLSNRPNR